MSDAAPRDNLIRARYDMGTVALRADAGDDGDGRTLFGHFAVFDQWTEIDSWYEGHFLERIAPGAFKRAFKDTSQVRIMFDHGHDPSIGMKPIAEPRVLREDNIGAYYEAGLFDAEYANQLLPALRTNQLGASFRFSVAAEEIVEPKKSTKANPAKLPERTITDLDLYEYGPVPWGAYPAAGQGVRSGSDRELELLRTDPLYLARFTDRVGLKVVEKILASADGRATSKLPADEKTDGHSEVTEDIERLRALTVRPEWAKEYLYVHHGPAA